jgi:predicted metal-binding membrane protein
MASCAERRDEPAARTSGTTALESALKRDRLLVSAALAAIILLCWGWLVPMAHDMYGSMTGPSGWMMASTWDAKHLLLLFGMWIAMMAGMMLPSAAPALLIYARVVRRSAEGDRARLRTYAFAAGYLAIWTGFSVLATVLQRLLSELLLLTPMMELRNRELSAALLIAAGVYQLTWLKRMCLDSCRSPVAFLTAHWRAGDAGAFRLGFEYGLFCLGCCWALMLLLFAGGVMNLYVIAAITVLVLAEKLAPPRLHGGRLSGYLLILAGTTMLLVLRIG